MEGLRWMALGQGVALIGLGAWPIVSMRTFERVTGPKHDDWLVRTVGGLCVAIGAGLLAGSRRPTEVRPLGIATAATFATVDIIGYRSGRLPAVYLLDAAAEGAIIGGWVAATLPGLARRARRSIGRVAAPSPASDASTPSALVHPTDLTQMHSHIAALLEEANHVVGQAWPGSPPPPPVREALDRLERAAQRLAAALDDDGALDPAELQRLARVTAKADGDAASIQEAAFLVSS